MQTRITIPASGRRWRSWVGFVFGLLCFALGVARAATPLNGAWREVSASDTPQIVLDEYHSGLLKSFDPSERDDMVEDDGKIHVTCEYCSRVYAVEPEALKAA